ncbi:MAG: hypothetical protein DI596_06795 [Azospira oryzae]|nr:MAG: hypothetical protein DI596_06795 [Azospira oryzae]PZP80255.1 MAG: hypothetical protein DI593_06795 [Azospira oryzae]
MPGLAGAILGAYAWSMLFEGSRLPLVWIGTWRGGTCAHRFASRVTPLAEILFVVAESWKDGSATPSWAPPAGGPL